MAETLQETLLESGRRPQMVTACVELVDGEVEEKTGVSGMAVKGGFAMVKKIKPGIITDAVDSLLDDFVARLQPFYADHLARGDSLPDYLTGRSGEVADALLGITDARAECSRRPTIKKAYDKLRPKAKEHVEAAVPRLGKLIEKHAA